MSTTKVVANRLPVWALTSIAIILVVYIGVLGGVAIWTERDVKFWPPEIGPGPKSRLVMEFKEARLGLAKIKLDAESQIGVLNTRLNEARSKQASNYSDNYSEAAEWREIAHNIEKDISRYEGKLIKKIGSSVKSVGHFRLR